MQTKRLARTGWVGDLAIVVAAMAVFLSLATWSTAVASKTGELIRGLYDDFDGHGCGGTAIEGTLNMDNWSWYNGTGEVVHLDTIGPKQSRGIDLLAPDAADLLNALPFRQFKDLRAPRRPSGRMKPYDWQPNPNGFVVRMESLGELRLELTNPMPIYFDEFTFISADFMMSSETTTVNCNIGWDHHFRIEKFGPRSYYAGIFFLKERYEDGYVDLKIKAHVSELNTSWYDFRDIGHFELDAWKNLRLAIVKVSDTELRFNFYLDGELMWSMTPPYSDLLLDPSEINFGPIRNIAIGSKEDEGTTVGYIDNIMAVYERPRGG